MTTGKEKPHVSMNSRSDAKIAFIVGAARSGTTLLTELLARHPDVHVVPETHFFRLACRSPRVARRTVGPPEVRRLADQLLAAMGFDQDAELRSLRDKLAVHPRRVAELAEALFRRALQSSGKSLLIEKTPDHALHWEAILCCIPEAKFIHIVRDPRDVTLSWQNVPWERGRRGYTFPARKWNATLSRMQRLARRHPSRLHEVKYEDLVHDAGSALKGVFAFLELAPAAVDFGARKPVSVDVSRKPWHAQAGGAVSAANVEKWRLQLPKSVQLQIDLLARKGMKRYGYPPSDVPFRTAGLQALGLLCRELGLAGGRTLQKLRWSSGSPDAISR